MHQWRSGFEAATRWGESVWHEIEQISEVGVGLCFHISACFGWQNIVLQVFEIVDSTMSEMLSDAAHLNLNSGWSYCMTQFSKMSDYIIVCWLLFKVT